VIRPAVESALAVARSGLAADPVVPPPVALRPFVGFAKQTPQSLRAVARVVERDDEFRARVVEAVDEAEVGRAGWLWLARPDGWEDELESLEAESAARTADEAEAREERSATRRLALAQAALQRAEAEAAARLADLEALRAELGSEREKREAADGRVADLEAEVATVTSARAEAVRNLKAAEARAVERGTEVNTLRARVRALEAEARRGGTSGVGHPAPPTPAPSPSAPSAPVAPAAASPAASPDTSASSPPTAAPSTPPDREAIVGEIARAASGAAAVAEGLAALARLLGGSAEGNDPAVAAALAGAAGVGQAASESATGADEAGMARRVPLTLPGGVFDDSVEAADHLLRTPGVILIVDGYNVSMTGWPDAGAAEQRRRLVAALHDLAARTSTPSEVVFDGAEVEALAVPAPRRQLVRVRFSPPGVEADDVVIDLVRRLPAATPLVVASSDNRVRDGVRRLGANVIHSRQLVELLARR
jgi:predicted RNA-binding protein with PIN domain